MAIQWGARDPKSYNWGRLNYIWKNSVGKLCLTTNNRGKLTYLYCFTKTSHSKKNVDCRVGIWSLASLTALHWSCVHVLRSSQLYVRFLTVLAGDQIIRHDLQLIHISRASQINCLHSLGLAVFLVINFLECNFPVVNDLHPRVYKVQKSNFLLLILSVRNNKHSSWGNYIHASPKHANRAFSVTHVARQPCKFIGSEENVYLIQKSLTAGLPHWFRTDNNITAVSCTVFEPQYGTGCFPWTSARRFSVRWIIQWISHLKQSHGCAWID